jgi:Lecithin retinol acyltransferase
MKKVIDDASEVIATNAANAAQSLPLGAHVVTPRFIYAHHGIYVGKGRVVQYRGLAHGLRSGPVEEVSLAQFTRGRPLRVCRNESTLFSAEEVARRARSRLGENRYHPLTNNCEHFVEWCLRAEHRSPQVDKWLAPPSRALQMMLALIPRLRGRAYVTEKRMRFSN